MKHEFLPILLGSDINVYGMARSFHEAYGIQSIAFSEATLAPTKYSNIVTIYDVPHFSQEETFVKVMKEKVAQFKNDPRTLILIACGDGYTTLVSKHKSWLSEAFICPVIDYTLVEQLENKSNFYEICEQHDLHYPKTVRIDHALSLEAFKQCVPFTYPIVLKPADSIAYLDVDFEGYKKAYILDTPEEAVTIIEKIYQHGYQDTLIVQDYIPGDDSHMRVMNVYVDQHHQVRMMCLGHPLLEDPTPEAVGNYVAILPEYNLKLYQQIERFLTAINYTGFANFDFKYDARDNTYKVFEINLRQGRSSFYTTLNGYNLATYLVDDYVKQSPAPKAPIYGNKDCQTHQLWLGVPKSLFIEYATDNQEKQYALDLIKQGRFGTTLFYKKDKNIKRTLLLHYIQHIYKKRFKTFFKEKQ